MCLSLIRLAHCQLIVAFVYAKFAISALLVDLSVCLFVNCAIRVWARMQLATPPQFRFADMQA